jgi:hypothetical protein
MESQEFLSRRELCDRLKLTYDRFDAMREAADFPGSSLKPFPKDKFFGVSTGAFKVWPVAEVEAWLAAHPIEERS